MTTPEATSTEVTTTVPGATVTFDATTVTPKADDGQEPFDADRAMKKIKEANREAESLRKRLKDFEDRDKTEAQKAAEAAEQHKAEALRAMSELTRMKVALRYQIPESDLDFLGDGDEEQIEARAKRLAELRAAAAAAEATPPSTRPRGDVDQGVRSASPLNGDELTNALKSKLGIT